MMRVLFLTTFLVAGYTAVAQTNEPPKKVTAEMMREMRLKQITMAPGELNQKPTAEIPHLCAVLMDWPMDSGAVQFTVTTVARTTGDASIYSTGTFGVFGGIGYEAVRKAATNCVKIADKYFQDATPAKDFPYPATGRVGFYLVGYDGVRVIERDLETLRAGKDKYSDLYNAMQQVITELRLIAQAQKEEGR